MPQRLDDLSIQNDDWLWRRIVNKPEWIARNIDGSYRLSSVAFLDDYTGEVSVDQAKLTTEEKALQGRPDDGLAKLQAGFPRSLDHIIVADPTQDNPAHVLICPPDDQSKGRRKANARKMAESVSLAI